MKKIGLLILFLIFLSGKVLAVAPVINSIAPNSGYNTTSTQITISGENFDSSCKISIGAGGSHIVGSVLTPDNARGVYIYGNYAYVACENCNRSVIGGNR